jgi:glycerol-3-phosphate dehydrogenase
VFDHRLDGGAARLGPEQRARALRRMADEPFDIVVVGGGVVGCGAALDAASRGLRVALVEQRDLGSGTSSRSSKLIHGGLRYLEQLEFGLVREALRERSLLLHRLAPHLVKPVPFVAPLEHRLWERGYVGSGMMLYDTLGGAGGVPRHRHLTRRGVLREIPALRKDAMVGGIQYHDGRVDDARHTMTVARTAALHGAAIATSTRVVGFARVGERVVGVEVRDLEDGGEFTIRTDMVINATGVWTDEVQELVGRGRIHVRASKGVHLVIPRDRIPSDSGLVLRTATSVLFVVPWGRHWIIGTTDTDWNLDLAHPAASRADLEYIFDHINGVLRNPITYEDVEGVYAGLRPLLANESEATSELSREHAVSQPVPGLVTVAGGKYTTYRVMARDAVDAAGRGLDVKVPASCTHVTPLVGADGYHALMNRRDALAAESGLHPAVITHLLDRYGSMIGELVALIAARPELGEPLEGAEDHLAVEAHYAASHEGAMHLNDVLTRRTRISIETWDRGVGAADAVAQLMGDVLGWDDATRIHEVKHYRLRVRAERESQEQRDDATADAARLGAPDVRAALRAPVS